MKELLKKTPLYKPLTRLYDKYMLEKEFWHVFFQLRSLQNKYRVIFIFPFYHTGGAEFVHLNIVKSIHEPSFTLFTSPSANDHFLKAFQEHSTCLNIQRLIRKKWHKQLLLKALSHSINKTKPISVFGCHSMFFYELLPRLKAHVLCIDLIHAFTHTGETGFEKLSIPYVERLDQRVVISEKGKQDLIELYKTKGLSAALSEKIQVIYNAPDFSCDVLPIKSMDEFNIVYVGRNSPEKRIPLIGKLATALKRQDPSIQIWMVGDDLISGVNPEDQNSCIFLGNITSKSELEQIYRKAHAVIILSTREGIPMALMEGMVFGAIPISTEVGGIGEILTPNNTGILIKNTDNPTKILKSFESAILTLYNDNSIFSTISKNCFNTSKDLFSMEGMCSQYQQLLLDQHE